MAKQTQPPALLKPGNFVITTLLRAGIKIGNMSLLTVRGRKSGQPRTTPVWLEERDGQRWLISPYGQVNWVRNLRTAGEATVTRGRRTERVASLELPPHEAAPMLKQSLASAPSMVRAYFDVTPDSPLEDFEREVPRHPVFLLKPIPKQ
jgi:deazaflavin-dependent oxidoreductase (nitroreductase family)